MSSITLRLTATIDFHGTDVVLNEVHPVKLNDSDQLLRTISYLIGVCEGVFSCIDPVLQAGCTLPIDIGNYDQLNEYEQMRAREILVLLSVHYDGRHISPVNQGRIKTKLELNRAQPRVLVYQLEPGV